MMWKISTSILAKRYAFVCLLCYHITATWAKWRLLVTLQSFPASTGRFYLVSLISNKLGRDRWIRTIM